MNGNPLNKLAGGADNALLLGPSEARAHGRWSHNAFAYCPIFPIALQAIPSTRFVVGGSQSPW